MAGVIDVLLLLAFSLHLLCMNVASAGPLVCCWLDRRRTSENEEARRACRFLANASLVLFVAGAGLGLLLTWGWWTPAVWQQIWGQFSSRIVWGGWELLVYFVCVAIYCAWLFFDLGGNRWAVRFVRSVLAVFASTNLLYHFPPLFVIFSKVSRPEVHHGSVAPIEEVSSAEFRRLLADPEVLSTSLHFLLASVAVAGMVVLLFGLGRQQKTDNPAAAGLCKLGGRIALAATVLQAPAGFWVFMNLPATAQNRLLGDDLLGTALFVAGVSAAVWLMHLLATIALGDTRKKSIVQAAFVLLVVIVLMTGTLRRANSVRVAEVSGHEDKEIKQ